MYYNLSFLIWMHYIIGWFICSFYIFTGEAFWNFFTIILYSSVASIFRKFSPFQISEILFYFGSIFIDLIFQLNLFPLWRLFLLYRKEGIKQFSHSQYIWNTSSFPSSLWYFITHYIFLFNLWDSILFHWAILFVRFLLSFFTTVVL